MADYDVPYQLSAEQRATFEEKGYLALYDILSPGQTAQVQRWTAEVKAWPHRMGEHMHYDEVRADGTKGHYRTENFVNFHPGFEALFRGKRLGNALATLFGEEPVLFKEKINYKEAGGSTGFRAHLDSRAYTHTGTVSHLSFLVAVDEMTTENGCLEVVEGSHKVTVPSDEHGNGIDPEWEATQTWVPLPVLAGGLLVFGSYLAHRSGANCSPTARAAIYATYNGVSEGDKHDEYYRHRRTYFPPPSERVPGKDYSEGAKIYQAAIHPSEPEEKQEKDESLAVQAKIDEVFDLIKKYGSERYEHKAGSSVTQLQHALQAGELAKEAGCDDATVVAALLHDIGHYLPHKDAVEMMKDGQSYGRKSHDAIGEEYLRRLGFPHEVTSVVGAHVDAKRYLTATDPTYSDQLSAVSKQSLKFQGGPFSKEEVLVYEKDPLCKQKTQLRVFDDKAKKLDYQTPTLESYRPMLASLLERAAWTVG